MEGDAHDHDHDHTHDHDRDHEDGHDRDHEDGHDHENDHDHKDGHTHENDRDHENGHTHEHDHHHDHGEPDPNSSVELEARARAIQSLLIEKGVVSIDAVETILSSYEDDVGPQNGARVVARAWTDPKYERRLLEDADAAISEFDFEIGDQHVDVVKNTPAVHNVVVCTLCSCYPWSLLGLPPTWYKSPEYRARLPREPRDVLSEFGVELDESIDVRVWDANSALRYLVLPQRPPGTDDLSEEELTELVTRDAMVGVERLGP